MVGYNVTEMIAEVVAARKLETTAHEIIKSVHPHPTMSEAIMEATAAAYNGNSLIELLLTLSQYLQEIQQQLVRFLSLFSFSFSSIIFTSNYCTSMTHSFAFWCSLACNKTNDWFLVTIIFNPF